MHFQHAPAIWADYPELAAGALFATGITATAAVEERITRFAATAEARLATGTESNLPEIQADKISEYVEVRYAVGDEQYLTFAGETEHPDPHEVTFADAAGRAHARRWTNRQSGYSAVRGTTGAVLVVAEAMHATAAEDVAKLIATLADELAAGWSVTPATAVLSPSAPRFECEG